MRVPSTSTIFVLSGCSVILTLAMEVLLGRPPARSAVRRHVDRKAEIGQVVQRLVDADQGPEPRVLHRYVERGGAEPLGPIDGDVNGEIDESEESVPRCED